MHHNYEPIVHWGLDVDIAARRKLDEIEDGEGERYEEGEGNDDSFVEIFLNPIPSLQLGLLGGGGSVIIRPPLAEEYGAEYGEPVGEAAQGRAQTRDAYHC